MKTLVEVSDGGLELFVLLLHGLEDVELFVTSSCTWLDVPSGCYEVGWHWMVEWAGVGWEVKVGERGFGRHQLPVDLDVPFGVNVGV